MKPAVIIAAAVVVVVVIVIAVVAMRKKGCKKDADCKSGEQCLNSKCSARPVPPDPYAAYVKGKVFLDQNNAHGAVVGSFGSGVQVTPDGCIAACKSSAKPCGGVAFNPKTPVCYLTGPGNYWSSTEYPDDYGWATTLPPA